MLRPRLERGDVDVDLFDRVDLIAHHEDHRVELVSRERRQRLAHHHEAAIARDSPCALAAAQLRAGGGAGLEADALPRRGRHEAALFQAIDIGGDVHRRADAVGHHDVFQHVVVVQEFHRMLEEAVVGQQMRCVLVDGVVIGCPGLRILRLRRGHRFDRIGLAAFEFRQQCFHEILHGHIAVLEVPDAHP